MLSRVSFFWDLEIIKTGDLRRIFGSGFRCNVGRIVSYVTGFTTESRAKKTSKVSVLIFSRFLITAWVALLIPVTTCAGESLDAILLRMKAKEVKHFNYTELKHMQLLLRPSRAEGEMFVSPKQLVVAQQMPDKHFISISDERILYVDPAKQIRRQHRLKGRFSVSGMEPLMEVFYGSEKPADLEKKFITGLSLNKNRWNMTLLPRQKNHTEVSKMTISGEEGAEPDHLELQFKDGDRTEWTLSLKTKGDNASEKMDQVLKEMNNSVDPWPGLSGS